MPIVDPESLHVMGLILVENHFETQILKSIESIQNSFSNLKPEAQITKLKYLILLVLMTVLILFSAVWLGFRLSKGITGPIQNLAEATREVALGNYAVKLNLKTDDEAGQLVKSFNTMTHDLESHRREIEASRLELLSTNEELEQRRKYMEVVLKNITAGVISVDAEGRVTTINNSALALLGLDGDIVGTDVRDGLGKELFDLLWNPVIDQLGHAGQYSAQLELPGRNLTLLAGAARIRDDDGDELGIILVFDDATEQVKAQKVAAWREVAQRIAHEIKNPVTPIKLNAQRLLRRYLDKFEGEDAAIFESCVETILKQVDSLRDLVNEFSKFSRLPSIKPKLENLYEIISDAVALFRLSYPGIDFQIEGSKGVPDFLLDKSQMNRVFVNLISNAISAISDQEKGVISFNATVLDEVNTVRIEVADNGSGIEQDKKDRVLEPYYSTKDEGTGLGLAIVNQIISDHGGYVRIADNNPGAKIIIECPMRTS